MNRTDDGSSAKSDALRSPTLEAIVTDGLADEVVVAVHQAARARQRRRLAGVAMVAVTLTVAAFTWWKSPAETQPPVAIAPVQAADAVTLQRRLEDGSVLDLNRGAEVRVVFTPELRRVELLRGQTHFQVAKNPSRPFLVVAGDVAVRAVGTGFAVELGREAVDVIVTEGEIAVTRAPSGAAVPAAPSTEVAAHAVRLVSGQQISVPHAQSDAAAAPQAITPVEMKDRLVWRVPLLDLAGTPLARALDAFNAHGDRRLVLADPELGRLELSGVLRADNIDALLRLLRDEFGVEAESHAGEVRLRRR